MLRESRSTAWIIGTLAVTLLAAAPVRAEGDKSWSVELGTEVSHRDNFFFRSPDGELPAPSATVTTLFGSGAVELDTGRNRWTLDGTLARSMTNDVENADYGTAEAGIELRRGSTRGYFELAYTPNRIFSEEADGAFFDLTGAALGMRQGFGRGFWVGVELAAKDWSFDAIDSGRDASSREIEAALRLPLGRRAGFRLLGEIGEKDADSPDYDWEGSAYGFALEWNPGERFSLFTRVKRRERDYINAPVTDTNFDRRDEVLLGLINMRVRVGRRWGLALSGEFRDAESTRTDRNYDASRVGGGIFFSL